MIEQVRFIMRRKYVLCFAGILLLGSCRTEKPPDLSRSKGGLQQAPAEALPVQEVGGVDLRIIQSVDKRMTVALENHTSRPIYVSYLPPTEGANTKFLAYGLERKDSGKNEFSPYGEGFHVAPVLRPIAPRTSVIFDVLNFPEDKGEYRISVGYYDDEETYKLVNEKVPNWTASEQEQIERHYQQVSSHTFVVASDQRREH